MKERTASVVEFPHLRQGKSSSVIFVSHYILDTGIFLFRMNTERPLSLFKLLWGYVRDGKVKDL